MRRVAVRWLVPVVMALGLAFPASVFADAPTAADVPGQTTLEDHAVIIQLAGQDASGDAFVFDTFSSPAKGSLTNFDAPVCDNGTPNNCTENVTYTPNQDANGSDSFTYRTDDSGSQSADATVSISITAVNDTPSFTKGSDPTVLEDSGAATVSGWATAISAGPSDESGQTTTFNVTNDTNTALFSVLPAIDGTTGDLTFTPATNANGSADITIDIHDNGGTSNGGVDTSGTQVFTINVTAVNDVPGFTKGSDPTVLEDAGAQSVPGWATAISKGPADEVGQTVHFNVTNDTNASLFSATPAISSSGTLTYTPAANANGSADITIDIQDNGGTANGGVDTSATQTFTIHVTAVNDVPSFTKGSDQTVLEDSGAQSVPGWATNISAGPSNESGQTVHFNRTNDTNAALFSSEPAVSANGTLTYTPATNANGSATITIDIADNGGTTNGGVDTSGTQTFTITVTAVNDVPSFTKGIDPTVLEDSGAATVSGWATALSTGPSNESGQTLTFNVTNDTNTGLFSVLPAIDGTTGDLTFTPAANANGSADITIDVQDNGGIANGGVDTSGTQVFTIHVTAVNDVPSFTKGADQTVLTDAGAQSITGWATAISAGPSDESAQVLTFNRTNDTNAALFSVEPAVSSSGDLTYTLAGVTGSATITIDIQDDGGTTNGGVDTSGTQTFTITVDNLVAHNDGATIPEGAAATAVDVLANDNPAPNQPVTLTITGFPLMPAHGTVAITGGGTGLTYKPNVRFYGSDSFSYTITHGALTAQATVVVTVSKDTTAPSFSSPGTPPTESIYTAKTLGTSSILVRIGWGAVDPGSGVVKYELWRKVDTGSWTVIALPTGTTAAVQTTLSIGHTYQFRVRATDFNGNISSIVYGPAFKPSLYQEGSSTITYSSTWSKSLFNSSNSGGYTRYTSTAGRSATFLIYTRDVAFVTPKSSIRGSVKIYVDNVLVATISEKSSSTLYRQILWSRHFSALGTHRIKIVAVGGARIDLDCFVSFR